MAELLLLCASRTPSPNDKLLRNLCAMAWSDPAEVPPVVPPATGTTATTSTSAAAAATAAVAASGGGSATEPDAAALEAAAAALSALDGSGVAAAAAAAAATPEAQAARVARLGGEAALVAACEVFGDQLWTRLPALWQILSAPLATADAVAAAVGAAPSDPAVVAAGQSLVSHWCHLWSRCYHRCVVVAQSKPVGEDDLSRRLAFSSPNILPDGIVQAGQCGMVFSALSNAVICAAMAALARTQVLACTGSSNSAVQLSGAGCPRRAWARSPSCRSCRRRRGPARSHPTWCCSSCRCYDAWRMRAAQCVPVPRRALAPWWR